MIELVLGGARSGKSRFAEQQAIKSGKRKFYIATALALDNEMTERIKIHQQRRGDDWETVEEAFALVKICQEKAHENHCLLIDCLTLWLNNLLHHDDAEEWQHQKNDLLQVLPALPGHIIMVSNEVGSGIIPAGELSRRFVDEIGRLHQELAQLSDRVILMVAGLPQIIKES